MAKDNAPAFTLVDETHEAYQMVDDLVARHHTTLSDAKIALVWAHKLKPDRDGHLVWGFAKKIGAQERLYHDHDFQVVLNAAVWQEMQPEHRVALLDHELSHCGSKTDDDGNVTYYLVKHDLEEFVGVVKRRGLWRDTIEATVKAALEHKAEQEKKAAATKVTA